MQDPSAVPVFVHCRRGADRSGVLIACYRMAHDHWSNEQALAEARTAGLSRFEPLIRNYIRRFDTRRVAAPASTLAMMLDFVLRDQLAEHSFQFGDAPGEVVDGLAFGVR